MAAMKPRPPQTVPRRTRSPSRPGTRLAPPSAASRAPPASPPRPSTRGCRPRPAPRFRPSRRRTPARTRRPRPLTDAEKDAVTAAYQRGGVSLDDLGTRYERSGDSIARLLRRAGVEVRPRGRTIAAGPAPEIRPGVAALHRQGMRPADIAARTSPRAHRRTGSTRELRRAGLVPHRGRTPVPACGPDLAVAYAEAGSVRALAASLHADEERIRGALAEAGVPAGSLRRIPAHLRPAAARLAADGTTPAQIAELTGLPPDATARLGQAAPHSPAAARAA